MASDTDTKKTSRWFRAGSHRGEIDQILDLYWGGPERRITGLTLKIIGLNIIALISLMFGVLYLGQYQNILIISKLSVFETEIFLLSAALSQSGLKEITEENAVNSGEVIRLQRMTKMLSDTLDKRILVFDAKGIRIADSTLIEKNTEPLFRLGIEGDEQQFQSVEILKNIASFILSLTPRIDDLEVYQETNSEKIQDYPDAQKAMKGDISLSVWRKADDDIILSAAMPIMYDDRKIGVVLLFSEGGDIRKAVNDAWFDIFKIFAITLFVTIFLSIYLSGVIARPLRKLARAAEDVRKGKADYREIPDMSERNDEIGELSLVLRDMTHALWERMDSIEAFAADVAHEIKNPLTSLRSAVETAHIVKKKEDMNRLLGVIQHDVERLDRLITDISHASRLDAELSRESFDKINIKQLLRNLINIYKGPLEREIDSRSDTVEAVKNDVTIRLFLPAGEDAFVIGSETRLIQVFQNIIANALSFSEPKSKIMVILEVTQNRVTLFFEDEGPGIPEKKLKTVFERFYSERPKHEDYGRHSGLGLSICKQIVTAHNGIIFAENRKDREGNVKGARFVVILNTAS